MRRFYTLAGVRDISDKEIRVIRRKANSGDPVACYQLAQLEMAWHWEDNYAEVANDLLLKAQEGGGCSSSLLWRFILVRMSLNHLPRTATVSLPESLRSRLTQRSSEQAV